MEEHLFGYRTDLALLPLSPAEPAHAAQDIAGLADIDLDDEWDRARATEERRLQEEKAKAEAARLQPDPQLGDAPRVNPQIAAQDELGPVLYPGDESGPVVCDRGTGEMARLPPAGAGHRWPMLVTAGHCWPLLVTAVCWPLLLPAGPCWPLLATAGHCSPALASVGHC